VKNGNWKWIDEPIAKKRKGTKNSTNYGHGQSTHTTQQKWNTQYNAFHMNINHTHLNRKTGTKKWTRPTGDTTIRKMKPVEYHPL
jgi:hypothetical protein